MAPIDQFTRQHPELTVLQLPSPGVDAAYLPTRRLVVFARDLTPERAASAARAMGQEIAADAGPGDALPSQR